jgi:hypothetical protein
MTSPRFGAALMAAGLAVIALPPRAAGDQQPGPSESVLVSHSHVRAFDKVALHVFQAAVACSPTVARMVSELQASDLIVGIEAHPFRTKVAGELRILAASGGARHVRIRLQTPNSMEDLLWILGHELHHAMEVAGAPEVRDQATQRAFFVRVGWERDGGGRFETEAAVEAGRVVAREVARCRPR